MEKKVKNNKNKYTGKTGRRKRSVARVRLYEGAGDNVVNGKAFVQYFPGSVLKAKMQAPFILTKTLKKYHFSAKISGGGKVGQIDALVLGISRALAEIDEKLRVDLRKEGFLTRDSRIKERKKIGRKKARKSPQFSKR